jgi:hypothetical protein
MLIGGGMIVLRRGAIDVQLKDYSNIEKIK